MITIFEPLIALGFFGLFGGATHWFLSTFPMIQLWQPKAEPEMLERKLEPGIRTG